MTWRISSGFSSTSASRKYSGTRPTHAFHTWATSGTPARSTSHPHPVARRQRHDVGVEQRVALLLPAVGVEALAEVAVPVEQADADEGHAEVARRLEVVAGQHAEAAGVLRDGLGDAELGREVGDQVERAVALGLEPAVAVEVALQLAVHLAQEPLEPGVVPPGPGAARAAPGPAGGPGRARWRPTGRDRPSGTGRGSGRPTTTAG